MERFSGFPRSRPGGLPTAWRAASPVLLPPLAFPPFASYLLDRLLLPLIRAYIAVSHRTRYRSSPHPRLIKSSDRSGLPQTRLLFFLLIDVVWVYKFALLFSPLCVLVASQVYLVSKPTCKAFAGNHSRRHHREPDYFFITAECIFITA